MVIDVITWRFRGNNSWPDPPVCFGPWQTVCHRFVACSQGGTCRRLLTELRVRADTTAIWTGWWAWTPPSCALTARHRARTEDGSVANSDFCPKCLNKLISQVLRREEAPSRPLAARSSTTVPR
ncbi:hypothetical protein E1283_09765 [Streptomyces hainanensis]|uniref:Transposase n=1 Tax=Streptomyces hainanensis TaxID=402648 RepID=A0A4R4TJ87_9ACTN|nr:hypothetical protein E1283_09765 [Streptomyces hainanensis]